MLVSEKKFGELSLYEILPALLFKDMHTHTYDSCSAVTNPAVRTNPPTLSALQTPQEKYLFLQ